MSFNENTDIQDFESFVKEHSDALYNYLKRLTGNGEDAEDVLQEVLIKIAERFSDLREPAKIKTWAFRIATTTAIDSFRKNGKSEHPAFDESLLDRAIAEDDIEDGVVVDEMNECIRNEISRMPSHYRTALVLFFYEHMTISEIAGICDISESSVKIRLHRGKNLLGNMLNEGCNFYYDRNSNMRCSSKSKE